MGFLDSLFGKKTETKSDSQKPSLEAIIGVNYKDVPTAEFQFRKEQKSDGTFSDIYEIFYDFKIVDLFNEIQVIFFGEYEGKIAKNIILKGEFEKSDIKSLNYMVIDLVYKYGSDKYGKGALTAAEKNELRDNFGDEDVSRWWEKVDAEIGAIMLNVYPEDNEINLSIHYQDVGWLDAYKKAGGK